MTKTGTIYADGRVLYDGYVPEKWRLLAISSRCIVVHSPGSVWWDNGGKHYGRASIDVMGLAELRRGNEEGTWRFVVGPRESGPYGFCISFHPVPKEACREAMELLGYRGDEIVEQLKKGK